VQRESGGEWRRVEGQQREDQYRSVEEEESRQHVTH